MKTYWMCETKINGCAHWGVFLADDKLEWTANPNASTRFETESKCKGASQNIVGAACTSHVWTEDCFQMDTVPTMDDILGPT